MESGHPRLCIVTNPSGPSCLLAGIWEGKPGALGRGVGPGQLARQASAWICQLSDNEFPKEDGGEEEKDSRAWDAPVKSRNWKEGKQEGVAERTRTPAQRSQAEGFQGWQFAPESVMWDIFHSLKEKHLQSRDSRPHTGHG